MKKITSFLLAVIMVLSFGLLTACSFTSDSSDSNSGSALDSSSGSNSSTDSGNTDSSTDSGNVDSSSQDSSSKDSAGGGDVEVEKKAVGIEYKSGLDDAYLTDTTPDFTKLEINLVYDDGSKEVVKYNTTDFIIELDLTKVNPTASLVINYKTFNVTKTVEVNNRYEISSVSEPSFYTDFNTRKKAQSTESNMAFIDNTQSYMVGDDNAFVIRPTVTAFDLSTDDWKEVTLSGVKFNISLVKWDGSKYDSNINTKDDAVIDADACSVDFNDSAVGNKYKVTVVPVGYEKVENFVKTFEFEVVDGYNVTNLAEFSLVDNRNKVRNKEDMAFDKSIGEEWARIRTEAGVKVDSTDINGVVLHNNIELTAQTMPNICFYGKESVSENDLDYPDAMGSLKDEIFIFRRNMKAGEKFAIHGNYCNIDGSKIPLIIREWWNATPPTKLPAIVVSHSALFKFYGMEVSAADVDRASREMATIENLTASGNLKKSEGSEGEQGSKVPQTGGIIFAKFDRIAGSIYNVNAKQWFITGYTEKTYEYNALNIEKNKYFDNYNCILYSFAGSMNIKDSIMKRAGGPVYIADHHFFHSNHSDSPYYNGGKGIRSHINVTNSKLESYVCGQEGWFVQMGAASKAGEIIGISDSLTSYWKKSFVKEDKGIKYFNFVGLMKSGAQQGMTFEKISGTSKIDEHVLDMDAPEQSNINGLIGTQLFGGVLLQTKGDMSALYVNPGDGSVYFAKDNQAQPIMPGEKHPMVGDSKYLNIYVGAPAGTGFMGVIIGDYHSVA